MTAIELVIFDMDGTICDSWNAMLYCYRETMKHFGRECKSDEEFYSCFTGYLQENLSNMLGFREDEVHDAVRYFRKVYEERGHSKSKVFDGIVDEIIELHSRGYKIGLATMTLEKYAVNTMKEIGLYDYFDCIHGSLEDGSRSKSDMIDMCMNETGVGKENTLMVGDGFNDLEASKKSGVNFMAAVYGFGITLDNCREYGIDHVDSPDGVAEAVIGYRRD